MNRTPLQYNRSRVPAIPPRITTTHFTYSYKERGGWFGKDVAHTFEHSVTTRISPKLAATFPWKLRKLIKASQ